MSTRLLLPAVVLLPLFLGWSTPNMPPVRGCASVPPKDAKVAIAQESAIIVWDEEHKTQHFIRRASFQTDAVDFGFLVPTPTQPELAESDNYAFDLLDEFTKPKIVKRYTKELSKGGKDDKKDRKVVVLQTKTLAGYKAVVLKASDAAALTDWLKQNGYQSSPALAKWLDPYVKSGWIVTAFKIAQDARQLRRLNTSAVRMSFKTEKPFFPYSEPTAPPPPQKKNTGKGKDEFVEDAGRLLRVYFVGSKRMAGQLGDGQQQWPGRTVWSDKLTVNQWRQVQAGLRLDGKPVATPVHLTIFEDYSSPRPGTADVYFSPSAEQTVVHRPSFTRLIYDPDGTIEKQDK